MILLGKPLQVVVLKILDFFQLETISVLVENFRVSSYQISLLG